jgi:hypothetical protein
MRQASVSAAQKAAGTLASMPNRRIGKLAKSYVVARRRNCSVAASRLLGSAHEIKELAVAFFDPNVCEQRLAASPDRSTIISH